MGRTFLVSLDQTERNKFFMCSTCHTPIALWTDYVAKAFYNHNLIGGSFENAMNVVLNDPATDPMFGQNVVAAVKCVQCQETLGAKFIQLNVQQDVRVKDGRYFLSFNELSFWDGLQLVGAGTAVCCGGVIYF